MNHKKLALAFGVLMLSAVAAVNTLRHNAVYAENGTPTGAQILAAQIKWFNRSEIDVTIAGQTYKFIDKKVYDADHEYAIQNYPCYGNINVKDIDNHPEQVTFDMDNYPTNASTKCTNVQGANGDTFTATDTSNSKLLLFRQDANTIVRLEDPKNDWRFVKSAQVNADGSTIFLRAKEDNHTCQDRLVVSADGTTVTAWVLSSDVGGLISSDLAKQLGLPSGEECAAYTNGRYVNKSGNPGDGNTGGLGEFSGVAMPLGTPENAGGQVTALPPGTGAGGSSSSNSPSGDAISCSYGALTWIACPVVDLAAHAVQTYDNAITNELNIQSNKYLDETCATEPTQTDKSTGLTTCTGSNYHQIWSAFRYLAMSLLIVIGLIMVISQAVGSDLFDAYTVRKVLPRLLAAVVLISLSWPLAKYAIDLSDVLGNGIKDLIFFPFDSTDLNTLHVTGATAAGISIGVIGLAGAALSAGGLLLFLLAAILAVFTALITLVVRKILIIFLVVLAPIALVAYILPGTQKFWKMWWDNFLRLLLMFPLIMAFIAAGRVFALSANSTEGGGLLGQVIAFIAYFGPYFALPMTFKMGGSLMSMAASGIHGVSQMGTKRLNAAGRQQMAKTWDKTLKYERFGTRNRFTRGLSTAMGAVVNPRDLAHGAKGIRAGRAASRALAGAAAAKENGTFQANMNDDNFLIALANEKLAQQKLTDAKRNYNEALRSGNTEDANKYKAEVDARQAGLSAAMRVPHRHDASMRLAAFQQLTRTGYQFDSGQAGYEQLLATANDIVGGDMSAMPSVMNEAQFNLKNAGRLDLAGINNGYTNAMKTGIRKLGNYQRGQGKVGTYHGGAAAWLGSGTVDSSGATKEDPAEIRKGMEAALASGETKLDDIAEWHGMLTQDLMSATDANKGEIRKQLAAIEQLEQNVNHAPTPETDAELNSRVDFLNKLRQNRAQARYNIDPSELNKPTTPEPPTTP